MNEELVSGGLMTQLCSLGCADVKEDLVRVNSLREQNYLPRASYPSGYISWQSHRTGTSLVS